MANLVAGTAATCRRKSRDARLPSGLCVCCSFYSFDLHKSIIIDVIADRRTANTYPFGSRPVFSFIKAHCQLTDFPAFAAPAGCIVDDGSSDVNLCVCLFLCLQGTTTTRSFAPLPLSKRFRTSAEHIGTRLAVAKQRKRGIAPF